MATNIFGYTVQDLADAGFLENDKVRTESALTQKIHRFITGATSAYSLSDILDLAELIEKPFELVAYEILQTSLRRRDPARYADLLELRGRR